MCQEHLLLPLLCSLQLLGSKYKVIIGIEAKHSDILHKLTHALYQSFHLLWEWIIPFSHADPSDLITYRRILAYKDYFANHHLKHPSRLYF